MGNVLELKLRVANDWTTFERGQLTTLVDQLPGRIARDLAFGVTDSGDPWCAVLDETGEVVVHVARIREIFVVEAEDIVTEGPSLSAAVDRFIADPQLRRLAAAAAGLGDGMPTQAYAMFAAMDGDMADPFPYDRPANYDGVFDTPTLPEFTEAQPSFRMIETASMPDWGVAAAPEVYQAEMSFQGGGALLNIANAADDFYVPMANAASLAEPMLAPPIPAMFQSTSAQAFAANDDVRELPATTRHNDGQTLSLQLAKGGTPVAKSDGGGDVYDVGGLSGAVPAGGSMGVVLNFFTQGGSSADLSVVKVPSVVSPGLERAATGDERPDVVGTDTATAPDGVEAVQPDSSLLLPDDQHPIVLTAVGGHVDIIF